MLPRRVEQVPRNRLREISVRLFDEEAVAKIEHVAVKGQLVAVSGFAKQEGCLTDEVECEIGEADVDLEDRTVAAPFAKALAKDKRVVAETKQIVMMRGIAFTRRASVERARASCASRRINGRQ